MTGSPDAVNRNDPPHVLIREPPGSRLRSWCGRDGFWGLALILSVVLSYQPVWHAGYLWDDDAMLTNNPCIVGSGGLKDIWTTNAADICPLTITTFWLEHKLWGLAPLPYHLVNVCWHAAGAILLWRVLLRLRVPGAWLGAALWALHPIQVESVAWISEMKNTESGVFYLLAILFFLRWFSSRDGAGRGGKVWLYGCTLLWAALAMASKSSTVILPVVLCLLAWWMAGQWRWRNLLAVGPIFFFSIAASVLSICTQALQPVVNYTPLAVRSWPQRLAVAGDAIAFYLGKLAWPHPLMMIYPRWEINTGDWLAFLPLLAVSILAVVLWLKRKSWGHCWLVTYAYFLVALLPMLGVVVELSFSRFSFVADHFLYLASMGPCALAAASFVWLRHHFVPIWSWVPSAAGAALLLTLGLMSRSRASVYESEMTLWTDTLAKNPRCWVGNYCLGLALLKEGQVDAAIVQYQDALAGNPIDSMAHNNFGVALALKGQRERAMVQYQEALQINPVNVEARCDLGAALVAQGEVDQAITQYQRALQIDPQLFVAHYDLGEAFSKKGQFRDAIAQYQEALQNMPGNADAHYNLANAYLKSGQPDEAINQYQQALTINPRHAEAHCTLGAVLAQKGRVDEAIVQYQEALQISPGLYLAHARLGKSLSQKGQVSAAIFQYEEALKARPDSVDAHYALANTCLQAGRLDEAIVQYQEALAIDPGNADGHDDLGMVFAQKGRVDEAIAQYQAALQINPGNAFAHGNLGVALAQKGQIDAAIAQLEEAIRLKGDYVNARDNLAKLQALTGQSAVK